MTPTRLLPAAVAALACALPGTLLSCTDDSVASNVGLEEPLQVEAAQFISGALPGLPAPPSDEDAGPPVTPDVVDVSVASTAIQQGEQGLAFTGHVSTDAQSVAVRFLDLGSGYWVTPVGGPDPSDNGLLTWGLTADFARGVAPGQHVLAFATVDADGHSGTQATLDACFDTPVPDNLNVCNPARTPPAAVLSLSWSASVDLDLSVENPDGVIVGGKSSHGTSGDAGSITIGKAAPSADGVLDHDSNAACAIDGIDREDIVWEAPPAAGTYQVWVDLFSACGEAGAGFTVSLWLAEGQADGTQRLVEQAAPIARGELLAVQANGAAGGSTKGLFVGQFAIQ